MSVLIRGMEMPNECRNCRMSVYHGNTGKTWCTPADAILADGYKPVPFDGRPDWCPLVELPEHHGDLIDADELKEHLYQCETNGRPLHVMELQERLACIDEAPTIIEAEGAEE